MKKIKRVGLIVFIFFNIGFIVSYLVHNGLWSKLMNGFGSIHFILYPVFIILFLFLVVLVHELGHLISFKVSGIKIRALLVLGLVFKKTKKGFKFEFFTPLIKLLGGLVVPDLPVITNDEEYEEVLVKFSKALIDGPKTSLFYSIIVFIGFILTWVLTSSSFLIGLLGLKFIITTLLTILVMLSSKVHTDVLYGDFVAYKKMKEDELFQLNQITQYVSFKLEDDLATNEYLISKITKYIKSNPIRYNLFTINLYAQFINLLITSNHDFNDSDVYNKITSFRLNRLINNKHGLELAYLISAYFYFNKDLKKSYDAFNVITNASKDQHDKKEVYLLDLKYSHLLNLKDNYLELIKEENLYSDDLYLLKPIIEKADLLKEALFQLEFVEYYTELYCNI